MGPTFFFGENLRRAPIHTAISIWGVSRASETANSTNWALIRPPSLLKECVGLKSLELRESPISSWRCSWTPTLKAYRKFSPALKRELGGAGFGSFLSIPRMQSNRRLISAICERWFGETNTFHFPCCELVITPLDFVMLTGILIEGKVIPVLSPVDEVRAAHLMEVSLEHLIDSQAWSTRRVKLSWLSKYFEDTDISSIGFDSPDFIGIFRRLLLYILGACFFMTDLSMVDANLLGLMDPVDQIRTFDWGGAIYSSILSGLRWVARGEGHSICFFYPFIELWFHEYLDLFRPRLKVPDETSFSRSSRWSAPSFKVDHHLLEKAREKIDRLTLTSVTLRPFVSLDHGVMAQSRGAKRFMGQRVAFSCQGDAKYFLGELVYHQFTGEFRIPHDPSIEMTAAWTRDALMEEMRTRGVLVDSFVGGVIDYSSYRAWLRSVSIGPIMRLFSLRSGATEVGGHLVEGYFQMESLLSALMENNRGLTEENMRLRTRFSSFEDPEITISEVPPFQCRPLPEVNPDFAAAFAQARTRMKRRTCKLVVLQMLELGVRSHREWIQFLTVFFCICKF